MISQPTQAITPASQTPGAGQNLIPKLNSPGDFKAWQAALAANWDERKPCVRVCDGTGCRALGSQKILEGLRKEISSV